VVVLRRSAQEAEKCPASPGLRFLSYFIGFGSYEMVRLKPLMFGDRFWTLIEAKLVLLCNQ
jgi:hypothetical protein